MVLCFASISLADAVPFSQQIGDADNFGPYSWESTATNGAQYTDYHDNSYQRTFIFDFGVPIVNVIQATLETNVYDLEDFSEPYGFPDPNHVDIQIWIEGYEVPGAFDDIYFGGGNSYPHSGIVTFNLMDALGSSALNDIFSDGGVTLDFLNAGTHQELYSIDYVTLSGDVEPIPEPSTILLLSSGLAGLFGIGRKRIFKS